MPYNQIEQEREERRRRKKNIAVKGRRNVGKNIEREIAELIKSRMAIDPGIMRVHQAPGGPIITVDSMRMKIRMMGRRDNLRDTRIWIEDDFTEREKEIQSWLENEAETLEEEENPTQAGYLKIRVKESWWNWNDELGELEKAPFRCEHGRWIR